jgi:ADP-ribose pyrophosphatase YjhB (NUDIX family)
VYCSGCGARLDSYPPVRCAACGAEHWSNPKPCAGALVERHGAVLLLRRAIEPGLGKWDVPGGFCEAEEHPEDTVVREVREETGLEVVVTGFLGMWLDRYGQPPPGVPPVVTLNCYYVAEPVDDRDPVFDPGEVLEPGWFGPDDLPGDPADYAFPTHTPLVVRAWAAASATRR